MRCIAAEPYAFSFEPVTTALVIIDMQRDFLEPGGFGAALGNDVGRLRSAIAPTARVLQSCRAAGIFVVHTREGHRSDLSDLAPAKRARGKFATGIGDVGPMGRILVRGEPGHDIVPELTPAAGEPVIDKPGKGAFYATDLEAMLRGRGIAQLIVCGVTTIRKYTPRAAMLGALAGISIAFISMRPAALSWQVPWIAFVSFGIILVSWMARVRLPWGLPGGLAAVLVGTILAWLGTFTGLSPVMDPHAVVLALAKFGVHLPIPSLDFLSGLSDIGPLLVVAVPLGIYNFTEGMNNVESASAAGDNFDLRKVLLADGIGALAGALLGSPFPPAVYIGHPGWKSVGGRIGYSLATGIVIALVCFLGLTALLLAVVPLVAILPILLYIGLVIGAQAFETTPARHAPAVILAMLPNIASWAQSQIDGALSAAGTSAAKVGMAKLAGNGVIYDGIALFGGGGTLAGLMLGAIAAFIIDRKFERAAIYAAAAAVLAFFGFINGTELAFANSAPVALGYLLLALICVGFSRAPAAAALPLDNTPLAEEVPGE